MWKQHTDRVKDAPISAKVTYKKIENIWNMLYVRLRLPKGLVAHPVDNYNFINMISQLFIDYTSNVSAPVIPSTLLDNK